MGAADAAKAAIQSLTKTAAKEWAHIPIRCSVIAPGYTNTPMLLDAFDGSLPEDLSMIPMKRIAEPQGDLVLLLILQL